MRNAITFLVLLIVAVSAIATCFGIFSNDGSRYEYTSIRGEKVTIYGKGIYKHMSADVAIQGIAQDYVTLFIGIPVLLLGLYFSRRGIRGKFVLSGTLGYFLVTYLFYTTMAMYNIMYLAYVFLLGASFFAFILSLLDIGSIEFGSEKLPRYAGIFLIINGSLVALLWLSIVLPPLFDGSIYPEQLQHYTTLIVQGVDLGLLLPMAFVSGILAIRKNSYGYLFTTIYVIFLSILMAALTSKILFMAWSGANVIPVIFIMPTICVIAALFSVLLLRNMVSGRATNKAA
jgi:hypothetical protein